MVDARVRKSSTGHLRAMVKERADAVVIAAGSDLLRPAHTDRRPRGQAPAAGSRARRESIAEAGGLMTYGPRHRGEFPPRRLLRRQDPQGRQARRSARRAADQVRAGHQPQDRQGPRPDDPAVAAGAGGSGDRVVDRRAFLGTVAVASSPRRSPSRRSRRGSVPMVGVLGPGAGPQSRTADSTRQGL